MKIGHWGEVDIYNLATNTIPPPKHHETFASRWGTLLYEPPEVGVRVGDKARVQKSRFSDIWAFGCVTLEALNWLLYGDFERARYIDKLNGESFSRTRKGVSRKTAALN